LCSLHDWCLAGHRFRDSFLPAFALPPPMISSWALQLTTGHIKFSTLSGDEDSLTQQQLWRQYLEVMYTDPNQVDTLLPRLWRGVWHSPPSGLPYLDLVPEIEHQANQAILGDGKPTGATVSRGMRGVFAHLHFLLYFKEFYYFYCQNMDFYYL